MNYYVAFVGYDPNEKQPNGKTAFYFWIVL